MGSINPRARATRRTTYLQGSQLSHIVGFSFAGVQFDQMMQ